MLQKDVSFGGRGRGRGRMAKPATLIVMLKGSLRKPVCLLERSRTWSPTDVCLVRWCTSYSRRDEADRRMPACAFNESLAVSLASSSVIISKASALSLSWHNLL
jgi:hypothetical protein